MTKINKYIYKNFFESFSPIFFSLFFMISIIYFIKFAQITAVIKITFLELGKLYIFMLPRMVIYIFPIVFFISIAITLVKMSKDNEMSVIFSFGVSPKKISKLFFSLSFIMTIFLMFDTIFLIPLSVKLFKNFIDVKKTEAKFNIKPSEFGQKFSNWYVFINKANKQNDYQDIIMYSKKDNQEQFIIAKKASIDNKQGNLSLDLKDGKAFIINEDNIKQSDYKDLKIYNKQNSQIFINKNILSYWRQGLKDKGRARDFSLFMLLSFFPLFSFLLAISIGIFNPRYEKNYVYFYIFIIIFTYYVSMMYAISISPLIALCIIPLATLILSTIIFKRKILRRY